MWRTAAIISKHQTSKISSNPACDQLDQKSLPQQDIVSPSLTNFFSDLSMQAHTCANHWTCTTLSYWPDLVTQNRYRYSNFENPHEVIVTLHQTHARINRTSLQTSSILIFKCLESRRPFKASFSHIFSPLITPCRFFFLFSDSFVNSQEWTLSRGVPDIRLGIVGSLSSGKSALVHRYLTGSYMQEESPEGGRFKKEVVVDGHSYLLLIRDEGGPPELQVTIPS